MSGVELIAFDVDFGATSVEDDGADDACVDDGYEVLVDESLVIGTILVDVVVVASLMISKRLSLTFLYRCIVTKKCL